MDTEKKYLDNKSLAALIGKIKSKVETITNQLDNKKATKDELAGAESRITAAEKDIDAAEVLLQSISSKLGGISSGAEVNQNAFSNVKVGSTTVAADAKQDTLELVAGTNVTISADAATDKISISAKDTTYNEATTSAAGLMSATDKTNLNSAVSKLSGISSGAEVNQNAFSNVKVGSTTVAADAKQDTLELVAGTNITIDADVANDKISISTTAEVNQNAFSNVKVGSTTVAADAKQDTLELVAGTNVTISADAATDKISISAKDTTYSAATTSAAGLMSATDKTNLNNVVNKLSGIASGAEVNQNAFSNVKVGSTTVAADAKQDTLELVQGSAIVLGADVANDKISISHDKEGPASGYTSGNTTTSISGSGGSGTIKIPQLTVDKYGHVTSAADENVTITIPTIPSTLKNPKALKFGSKTYDGSAEAEITAADLGLSSALKYHGTTTTAISDGATTNPIVIGGSNHTATQGCVVAYGKKEFVWTGSVWEELGNEGNYKVIQTAVSSPSASGSTTAFIDTISQDTNGKITVTKKNVSFPSLASYVTGPGSSTANHVAVFKDTTGKVIKDSGFTIGKSVPSDAVFTDRSVTSVSYHYTPAEDTNSAISASGGSATNITGTGGKLNVVTGLKRDAKGHIVGVTSANIYSTDNNTDTNHYPTAFAWTNGTTAGPTGSLTGSGMSAVSFGAIPSASATTSGVVTTGAQTFAGSKTFTDNINLFANDNDRFINFKSTPNDIDSYSWRIGYLGTGFGDDNALTFQTSKTGAWVDALKFTLSGDATFSQSVTATKFITSGGTSSQFVRGNGDCTALTKSEVTTALGYTPPTTNTTYGLANFESNGLMSATTFTTMSEDSAISNLTNISFETDPLGDKVSVYAKQGVTYVYYTRGENDYIESGVVGTIDIPAATTTKAGVMSAADKTKLNGIATGANKYTLPNATSSTLGGVKIGSNISVSNGTISLSKSNVTSALGYTPIGPNTAVGNLTGNSFTATDSTGYSAAITSDNIYLTGNDAEVEIKVSGITAPKFITAGGTSSQFVRGNGNCTALTKSEVTTALGYTPPTTNTTYGVATTSANGLMPKEVVANMGTTALVGVEDAIGTVTQAANKVSVSIETTIQDKNYITGAIDEDSFITSFDIPQASTGKAGVMSAADKTKLDGIATGANKYTLPNATSSTLGGVKIGSNISVSSGTISLSKSNVTSALGYTPPTTSVATTSAAGLMSAADKTKLNNLSPAVEKITYNGSTNGDETLQNILECIGKWAYKNNGACKILVMNPNGVLMYGSFDIFSTWVKRNSPNNDWGYDTQIIQFSGFINPHAIDDGPYTCKYGHLYGYIVYGDNGLDSYTVQQSGDSDWYYEM